MKLLAVTLGFAFLLLVGVQAGDNLLTSVSERTSLAATFINDSVVVDVGENTDEDAGAEEVSNPVPEDDIGGNTVLFSGDDEEEGGAIDTVVVEVTSGNSNTSNTSDSTNSNTTDNSSSNSSNGSGGTNGTTNTSNTTEQAVSASSVLNTLTGNQAITNVGGGSGGASGTSVSGDKTREALLSRSITKLTIPTAPTGSAAAQSRPPYSRADLALIVSAALVTNPEIEDVFFSTNALTITYTAGGRLLFALPVPYTATLDLKFNEATQKSRVRITFPWYKFLMYTGVSKSKLRAEVDGVITGTPQGEDYDRAAEIFAEVTALLETTHGFRGLQ